MTISHNTIDVAVEVFSGISVGLSVPDADTKWQRLSSAYQELVAAKREQEKPHEVFLGPRSQSEGFPKPEVTV